MVSGDLKWKKNTDYIRQKAIQKVWTLRRLTKFNLDAFQLLDVYEKEVRSLLEYAVLTWHQSTQVEVSPEYDSR